jgi:DNA invertase Pin-like site-specific DNA recombinase
MATEYVIVYCRISSKTQSLGSQYDSCSTYCLNNQKTISKVITEIGSAKTIQNLKKLKKLINTEKNITILVYSIDRFCRNTSELQGILNILSKNNIKLLSVSENVDLVSASGKHTFRMRVSAAELEIDLLSERVRRSIAFRKSRGDYFGSPKYGYSIIRTAIGQRFQIKTLEGSEPEIIKFITEINGTRCTARTFTKRLYDLMRKIGKTEDFFVPIVLEENDKSIHSMIITSSVLVDTLNDYSITRRGKKWTNASISKVISEESHVSRILENLSNNFDKVYI